MQQRYSITFIVGDVNDNPPIFEKSLYEEKIKEVSLIKMMFVAFCPHLERNYCWEDLKYWVKWMLQILAEY